MEELLFGLVDYTLLDKTATDNQIIQFVEKAVKNKVVAICIYPQVLPLIYSLKLNYPSFPKICIVINFPYGKSTKNEIYEELTSYDLQFVDEIDVVWNYNAWGTCGIGYDPALAIEPIDAVIDWCENEEICNHRKIIIKVILETGYLCYPDEFKPTDADSDYQNLRNAIYWILSNFHDSIHFLKTSTGKSEYGGASIEAVKIMIDCIRKFNSEESIGIKVSGGINKKNDIFDYLYLFEELNWKGEIRFGSSKII